MADGEQHNKTHNTMNEQAEEIIAHAEQMLRCDDRLIQMAYDAGKKLTTAYLKSGAPIEAFGAMMDAFNEGSDYVLDYLDKKLHASEADKVVSAAEKIMGIKPRQ